jgi:Zn finger protein HypA/HybF involved in hydrogenase expression
MDEMRMASSLLESIHEDMSRHGRQRPTRVGLRVGECDGIDRGSLKFYFEGLAKGTDLEGVHLEMEPFSGEDGDRADGLQLAYVEFEECEDPPDDGSRPIGIGALS